MHIPARYYKRIPKFYFIVGILLILTSFNMEGDKLAAYLYFISGVVSIIYAVSVYQARARGRKKHPLPATDQPVPDDDAPHADQQQSADDDTAQADEQESESGTKDRDLPQHGGGVPSPSQSELKP